MKLRYIFSAMLAATVLFAGCTKEDPGTLDVIQLSETYLSIPEAGGTASVEITATADWAFVQNSCPDWLSVDKRSGAAGTATVTFTAPKAEFGREAELSIQVGTKTQFLRVRQGSMTASKATCQDVIDGPEGKSFIVEGVCTSIADDTLGNWYIEDETGTVYIYGTLDAEGKTKNFSSLNIEVGDVVKIQGPKKIYVSSSGSKTIELENVKVLEHKKTLVMVLDTEFSLEPEGGKIDVRVAYKGKGAYVEIPEESSWVSYGGSVDYKPGIPTKIEPSPADTAIFKLQVSAMTASGTRTGQVTFWSYDGENASSGICTITQGSDATAADINAAADGNTPYRISGYVSSIADTTYGNLYISDYTGTVYVYGTLDAEGKSKNFASLGISAGDIVTVTGPKTSYKGSPQLKNVTVEKHSTVKAKTVAEFLAAGNDANVWYRLTGKVSNIANAEYGNFDLTDETGKVYGCAVGYNGQKYSKTFGKTGIKEGDTITIVGTRNEYMGTPEVVYAFHVAE